MQDIKIIYVDSLTDLEPERNFLIYDGVEQKWYIGNGTSTPDQIEISSSPTYANNFLLMGG